LHIWLLGATGFKESRYPPAVRPPYHVPCTRDTMQGHNSLFAHSRLTEPCLSSRDPRCTRLAASGGVHTATLQLPCRIRKTGHHVHLTCHIIPLIPRPRGVIPRHCSAAALQLRPQGPYTRRHDDATTSTRLRFRQTWLRPQGPYTRRHEDATTTDPVEVSSDSVEVSSDSVEVSSDPVEVSSDSVEVR
jgi:hypothetical protein